MLTKINKFARNHPKLVGFVSIITMPIIVATSITYLLLNYVITDEEPFDIVETVPIIITYPTIQSLPTLIPESSITVPSSTPMPTLTLESTPTDVPTEERYNFILLGGDYIDGRSEGDVRTDAIIVVSIRTDVDPMEVTLISLPRELLAWVDPNYGNLKLNRVFNVYGFEGIKQVWSPVLVGGFDDFTRDRSLDGIAYMDMNNFLDLIGALGGIRVVVDAPLDDTCNGEDYLYDGHGQGGTIYYMNAMDVLCYARMRYNSPNGYFDRMDRHLRILDGIQRKIYRMMDSFGWDDWATLVEIVKVLDDFIIVHYPNYPANVFLDSSIAIGLAVELLQRDYTLRMISMTPDVLQLMPRNSDDDPYIFAPLVEPWKWMDCALNNDNPSLVCNDLETYQE